MKPEKEPQLPLAGFLVSELIFWTLTGPIFVSASVHSNATFSASENNGDSRLSHSVRSNGAIRESRIAEQELGVGAHLLHFPVSNLKHRSGFAEGALASALSSA